MIMKNQVERFGICEVEEIKLIDRLYVMFIKVYMDLTLVIVL